MHRKQSGFTIVELVVVIILLGILAATALPRFIEIDDDARNAVLAATQGGIQTGVSMFHSEYVAEGAQGAGSAPASFNGLLSNVSGYPYGTTANAGNDVSDENDCVAVFQNVMQAGAPTVVGATGLAAVAGAGPNAAFVAVSSATPDCSFVYTAEATPPSGSNPALIYNPANGSVVEGTVTLP